MSALLLLAQVLAVLTGTADARAIATGPDGAVWVGTTGGLVREHEEERRVYTPRDGLPDGTVRSLLRRGETLWVGTDRGAAECAVEEDGALRVRRVVGPRLRVESMAMHEGRLHLGTTTGLFVVGETLEPIAGVGRVTGIASAPDGLYVASPGRGAYRIAGGRARRLRGDRLAWDVAVDGADVWVATSSGLQRHRRGRRARHAAERASRAIPRRDLRAVAVEGGALVVGSYGGGVWRREGERFERVLGVPEDARVTAMTRAGGEWLAATPEGVRGGGRAVVTPDLPDNDLSALAQTAEGLWIGTFDHGLVLRAGAGTRVFDEASGLLDDRINRLAVDAEGDLWVATDRGVVERQGDGFVLRGLLERHVFALAFVDGAIHAGAGADVYRFDGRAFEPVAHPGSRPQDFVSGSDDLIVASAEGLASRSGGTWSLRTSDDGLSDDWTTAVAVGQGTLFVGTYASGVAQIRDGRVRVLRDDLWVNAGAMAWLPSETLALGTLDDGLWLLDGGRWSRLGTADGLPDDDVTAVLPAADGSLWVATRGGLALVDPS